jgi:ATP-binding cassette subfamily G (WHITE) protein 2 (PDR)
MSIVGNITTNYDASARRSGFPLGRRRYSLSRPLLEAFHREKSGRRDSGDSTQDGHTSNEQREEQRIVALARQFSMTSSIHLSDDELDPNDVLRPRSGTIYDPFSENFNAREWIKSLLRIAERDPDKFPGRTAGIAFQNLSVHGFASDVAYQKTVGNVILSGLGTIRDLTSSRKRKVPIIKQFDGIVEAGEMLVVLGPPGRYVAACSTSSLGIRLTVPISFQWLFDISENDHRRDPWNFCRGRFLHQLPGYAVQELVLHPLTMYPGIAPRQMQHNFRGEAIYSAEQDVHFPQLTVGDTLGFAAEARAPRQRPGGMSRHEYGQIVRDVVMASLGISHTINTKV